MSARVLKRVSWRNASILVFVVVAALTTLFMVRMTQGEAAAPLPPGVDPAHVPHYFGPWPNWALSPLTLPDATVTIDGTHDTTATAVATVGGNGVITGITVTDPGSGYTVGAVTVGITGSGSGASADASVTVSSAVSSVSVTASGQSYTKPGVVFSGGGTTTQATGTAYGGVDAITLASGGDGYTFPTVDFDMPDDPNGVQATAHATMDANGTITAIVIDNPGSGYAAAPGIAVHDGTLMDPINHVGTEAAATTTIKIDSVGLETFGAGYTSAPAVAINETAVGGAGTGATATAKVAAGTVTSITVTSGGSGYVTGGGIKKFQDELPGLCNPAGQPGDAIPACAVGTKYIPLGVPVEKNYNDPDGKPIKADVYEIGLVQYRTSFSSSLPAKGSMVRGYVQIETPEFIAQYPGVSQHFPLTNELRDGTKAFITWPNGDQMYGVTEPQWLGPTLAATKDKPVRVVFRNLLPTGSDGDLFIPTDTTLMGSGYGPVTMNPPVNDKSVLDEVRNPPCTDNPQLPDCFKQDRATLHLHGGITPWISDGTPHQWITPANEDTPWPQGVSVQAVPDMTDVDTSPTDGIETFYYTNQQSARLMFYHDHAWGITRLNVYIGGAAGYLISDNAEKTLIHNGVIPGPADTIPLIIQDRTFVPQDSQLYDTKDASGTIIKYGQDPTWDKTKWGDYGDLWYHHVYMPAQNPGDPSGMSAYGRWMYGPWFWPPASATVYGPIANPYYDPNCNMDDPATWTYDVMPYCEPQQIPGTPNLSVGMEQFNDTPIVNGVAYPKVTLDPKSYRLRILNAANDRFFNLQWYVADPRTGTLSEVALNQSQLDAAQTDPSVFPTPDTAISAPGPNWIAIASEGGFLPAPAVINGSQPTTWITDPTRFDFGNVDKHSLVVAPAERADVIVDFSAYAGKTLIMYNDAPAAYPARIPSYDYYTGAPDLSPNGAPVILPGYGPNTRTVMQVTINAGTGTPFNLQALRNAFSHKANGTGVFESSQNPIIVGQAAYNSAYGTSFSASSNCNAIGSTLQICDGLVRVNDTQSFGFNTLKAPTTKTVMPLRPKAIHDEMNATTFDEYGRMQANLGVEAQPPTPGLQNVTLYPYINPSTELIDGTNLPREQVVYDADGNVVNDVRIAPITDPNDGSQIWRITHNGVDTHPIHFHLYDVQVLNRVTWDNIIIPTEPDELGWKDTIRVSPLEDTIVALRPVVPQLPWELPNAIRDLSPMMPTGATAGFNNVDPQGNPTTPIMNQLVNFGWEYVWHCHILSHEEMDMMRPQTFAMPPNKATGLTFVVTTGHVVLTFNDNSINETSFLVQRTADGVTWTDQGTIIQPLDQPNIHQTRSFTDPAIYSPSLVYGYRVVAQNTVGYGAEFPTMTVGSTSTVLYTGAAPVAPSTLTAQALSGPRVLLSFLDNATDEAGFTIQRAVNGGTWTNLATPAAHLGTGPVTYTDTSAITAGNTYAYRVRADKGAVSSAWSNTATVTISAATGVTVTAPGTGGTYAGGSNLPVTWSPNVPTVIGEFGLWIVNGSGGWYSSKTVAANGNATYNNTVALNVPAGTNYRVAVTYRPTVGSGAWTVYAYSASPGFTVQNTTVTAISVTQPPSGGSYQRNSTLAVAWTPNGLATTGQYGLWLVSGGGWYMIKTVAATGLASYTNSVTLSVPAGTGYRVAVTYRPTLGTGAWTAYGYSASPGFTVTGTLTSINVTQPPSGGTYARSSALGVAWTPNAAANNGEFGLWVVSSTNGWYLMKTVAATGLPSYTDSITLNVPVGTGYRVAVTYRSTIGTGTWTVYGYSASPGFTVN